MKEKLAALGRPRKGQSLILVALATFYVLIAFTAVAVDGGNYILTRRNLQHAADAAALAAVEKLTWGATTSQAKDLAITYVYSNTEDIASLDPVTTTTGTGTGLTNGVEVSWNEARVVLNQSLGGYFTDLMGLSGMKVSARAHAGFSKLGLVPVAVRRYDANNTPKTDFVAREGITNGSGQPIGWDERSEYSTAQDWPRPTYGGTMQVWVPNAGYESTLANPGPEFPILGAGVATNNGVSEYNGLICLDVRHITSPPTEFYSGVSGGTNSQTLKALESSYFQTGYRNPATPGLGDQVSILNGVSNSFAAQLVQSYYRVGSLLPVTVYSGMVWDNPGYTLQVYRSGGKAGDTIGDVPALMTDTVYYDIAIEPDSKVNQPLTINLTASAVSAQNTPLSMSLPASVVAPAKTKTVYPNALAVRQIDGMDPPTVAVVTVHGYESSFDAHRFASVTFRSTGSVQDYTIYGNPQRVVIDKGGSHPGTISLVAQGVNGQPALTRMLDSAVVGISGWPSWLARSFVPADQMVDIRGDGKPVSASMTVSALANANAGTYDLRIYLRDPGNSSDKGHFVRVELVVVEPWDDPLDNQFVIVEGYTFVKVTGWWPTGVNANQVNGRVVGPFVASYEELPGGGRLARLIDWNDAVP